MYKLYRKNPENFAFTWIGIYCLVQSLVNGISAKIGISKSAMQCWHGCRVPICCGGFIKMALSSWVESSIQRSAKTQYHNNSKLHSVNRFSLHISNNQPCRWNL